MRTVLKDSREVAHIWASRSQPEGRCSNVFFEGDTIYSYGYHFPMARFLPDGSVAITTRSYSNTTSKHISYVRYAVSHLKRIYVQDVTESAIRAQSRTQALIDDKLKLAAKARMAVTKEKYKSEALHLAEQFNLYAKALKSRKRITTESLTKVDFSQLKTWLEKKERAEARKREAELKKRQKQIELDRQSWRNGIGHHAPGPVMLRLGGYDENQRPTEVQTSASARIPVSDALRLWPFIERVRRGEKDYEVGMHLGPYRLTQIMSSGDIRVGCHSIEYSEITAIADQLGLRLPESLAA